MHMAEREGFEPSERLRAQRFYNGLCRAVANCLPQFDVLGPMQARALVRRWDNNEAMRERSAEPFSCPVMALSGPLERAHITSPFGGIADTPDPRTQCPHNARAITLERTRHFSCLEKSREVADLILKASQ
jgi:hypothetical protein